MAPNHSSVYGLTLGLMLCAAPSIAQNLITNPAFDDALNGWTTTGSSWSVVVDDANPCASVEASFETATIFQCVPEIAAEYQVVGMSARRLSGDLQAFINLEFYSQPDCTGSMGGPLVLVVDPTETWLAYRRSTAAPNGAQSVRLPIATSPATQGTLRIDDVELFPALFADGFDDGTAEAWTRIETGT